MTAVDVFFAASTAGGYVLPLAALFAAAWAIARAAQWTWRIAAAARQWQHDTRVEPTGSSIDDAELADWLALGTDDMRKQQREEG